MKNKEKKCKSCNMNNPAGTPEYRNGTKSFFGLKGRPSVVRDV